MANLPVKDSGGNTKYMKTAGAGSDEDPHIPEHSVSGTVQLAAGTNGIGKLTANSGVDIGDVDVTSIAAGDNNIGNVDLASAIPAGSNLIGKVSIDQVTANANEVVVKSITAGDNNIGNVDVATIAAGENVIGLVGSPDAVITVTPTLDTNAYASGDLLFDSTEVAAAVRANAYTALLQSVTIIDKADQGVAFTLLIANAATDFGTLNAAPDPDDTEAATVIGHVPIAASDYVDLGASKVACIRNIGLLLKAGAATTSLHVAGINGTGTPTYANGDLVIQLGFLRS
jgi:hypothetical protein